MADRHLGSPATQCRCGHDRDVHVVGCQGTYSSRTTHLSIGCDCLRYIDQAEHLATFEAARRSAFADAGGDR